MAWPEDIKKYDGVYDKGYQNIRNKRYQKQLELGLIDSSFVLSDATYNSWDSLTKKEQVFEADKMEVYAAMIDRMDQNVGRLLERLKELELDENTIILFVSDNGASAESVSLKDDNDNAKVGSIDRWVSLGKDWANVSNTPFRYYKNYSHEGGIRTPLIVNWPNKIKKNSWSQFPGHFIDVMPTFVDIAQAEYPEKFNNENITPMRGVSLLPSLLGNDLEREKPLFWAWNKGRAVRLGQWKLVKYREESSWELYNLDNDPTEMTNIVKSNPKKANELVTLFDKWILQYQQ